jgi:hypothetical protein
VIANTFEYNEGEEAVDYHRPSIHSINKQEFLYDGLVKHKACERLKNVMIMGDILEDARMVRDSEHSTVLKGRLPQRPQGGAMLL